MQESIFAALLGKLIWDCTEMLIREYQESKTHLNSLVPAVVSIASASLIAILTLPFVYGVILSVLFGLMFYYFKTTKAHSRLNIDPLALSFVFLIGIEAAIPLESLSFLIWNSFFETNGFLLVPLEILTAILVGYLLPLPLSLGGGAYLAFFIFGWPGMWGALLLFAFIMAVNLKMFGAIKKIKLLDKKIVHAIKIPFVCSATVSFLFMIINYPLDLNWSSRSLFLCLLSLGLSIRKWSFYRVFSLGLIVAMTEISLEFLSGSLSS